MSHNWGSLMSALSIALSCIYISTILHDILLCQSGQGYGYFWQISGYKGLCHLINTTDESGMWFDIFTLSCLSQTQKGVKVWTCHLQQGAPYPQAGPCEFYWDQPKHSWGYPWGVCVRGSWCDLAHLLQAALLPVRGWHPPAVLVAYLPTPLPTSPPSLVKIPAHWFFQGWSPWGWYGGTTLMILGRPYLLFPLR